MSVLSSLLLGLLLLPPQQDQAKSRPQSDAVASKLEEATSAFKAGSKAYGQGDLMAARRSFERAVQLAPAVSAAHAALGSVLLLGGSPSAAIKELQVALQLAPDDQPSRLNLALAFAGTHQDQQAADTIHRLQSLDPTLAAASSRELALPLATSSPLLATLPSLRSCSAMPRLQRPLTPASLTPSAQCRHGKRSTQRPATPYAGP